MSDALPLPDPGVIDAVKEALMKDINAELKQRFVTQQRAADALGTTQPNIAALASQKTERFSIPYLLQIASRLGLNIEIGTSKPLPDYARLKELQCA